MVRLRRDDPDRVPRCLGRCLLLPHLLQALRGNVRHVLEARHGVGDEDIPGVGQVAKAHDRDVDPHAPGHAFHGEELHGLAVAVELLAPLLLLVHGGGLLAHGDLELLGAQLPVAVQVVLAEEGLRLGLPEHARGHRGDVAVARGRGGHVDVVGIGQVGLAPDAAFDPLARLGADGNLHLRLLVHLVLDFRGVEDLLVGVLVLAQGHCGDVGQVLLALFGRDNVDVPGVRPVAGADDGGLGPGPGVPGPLAGEDLDLLAGLELDFGGVGQAKVRADVPLVRGHPRDGGRHALQLGAQLLQPALVLGVVVEVRLREPVRRVEAVAPRGGALAEEGRGVEGAVLADGLGVGNLRLLLLLIRRHPIMKLPQQRGVIHVIPPRGPRGVHRQQGELRPSLLDQHGIQRLLHVGSLLH
mmetsp:Transcript_5778/g.16773  ORF Transcript_5778/g.16773 Transcript_5778/m.16773 type:complete len:412 (+) Transcript_5778:578-1813(+)